MLRKLDPARALIPAAGQKDRGSGGENDLRDNSSDNDHHQSAQHTSFYDFTTDQFLPTYFNVSEPSLRLPKK